MGEQKLTVSERLVSDFARYRIQLDFLDLELAFEAMDEVDGDHLFLR